MNRTLDLGTDVAAFLIYHPDDLAHRADAPLGWYGYHFAYLAEARAGRLVAIGTGADGGYRIRLTTGALTPAEAAAETARVASPLVVRHGRVFLDNTDGLPGPDRMIDPDEHPDQWIELANGPYRVTVAEIDWSGDEALPSYVVQFEAVDALEDVEVPVRFPGRSDLWHTPPSPPSEAPTSPEPPLDARYPLFVMGRDAVTPGQTARATVARDLAQTLWDARRVVAVETAPEARGVLGRLFGSEAALGTLARIRGARWGGEDTSVVRLEGVRLVAITDLVERRPLPTARVRPVPRPDAAPSETTVETFLDALHAFAVASDTWADQPHPRWTLDRLAARDTSWREGLEIAVDRLGLAYADRLALAQASDAEQVAQLTEHLRRPP